MSGRWRVDFESDVFEMIMGILDEKSKGIWLILYNT